MKNKSICFPSGNSFSGLSAAETQSGIHASQLLKKYLIQSSSSLKTEAEQIIHSAILFTKPIQLQQ